MSSKSNQDASEFVPEQMMVLVQEINELARVRSSLALGTRTGIRDSAESIMSRRINERVKKLSQLIADKFGKDE